MKPAVDEMFPEGAGPYVDLDEAGGSTGLLMDLAANEKAVHADFFNGEGSAPPGARPEQGCLKILKISLMMMTSSELSCPAMQCWDVEFSLGSPVVSVIY
ncbi:COP9 signalosome complex subunit 9 isoform X1 [Cygnus atratus]|uniref:COP9 signalosome complex subunit 9 isoform X1 n=1 Tax=Cygnus atratus TaxID=8868 RepID=UPI0015D628FF|nr:COP9 signalosome complex subunit 9 isoform X1 [Cygnus atratus]